MAANTNYKRYINEEQAKSLVKDIHTFVQDEDSSLAARVRTDLQQEVAWRKAADIKLNEKLNKETELRIADVDNEETRATTVEGNPSDLTTADKSNLVNAINSEVTRSKNVEGELDQIPSGIATPKDENSTIDLATAIKNENTRAISEETRIDSKLNDEILRAKSEEKRIEDRLNGEIIRATSEEAGLQKQITDNNNKRIEAEGDLKSKDWTSNVNYSTEVDKTDLATAIYTEHKRAVKSEGRIADIGPVFENSIGVSGTEAKAKWNSEDANLANAIISSSMLDVKLDSNTTQNITGGLNIADGVIVDTLKVNDKVGGDLNINGNVIITQNTAINGSVEIGGYTKIDNNTDISGQLTIKKTADASSGNLVTEGNINANGNVTIEGNLIVKGETVTEIQKTLEVDDNLIVTRANAETSPITPSGLLININSTFDSETGERTSNNSMGIVYNPNTDSVDLGVGQLIESENNNEFTIVESNPIVIRDGSDSIEDNEFTIWEKETKEFNGQSYVSVKAISSGIVKNSATNETFADNSKDNSFVGVANRLNTNEINTNTNTTNIANEIVRAKDVESVIKNTLNNEISRATAAENVLTQNINKEVTDRSAADTQLQKNIDNEAAARESANNQLQTNIEAETARAIEAEGTLQSNIDKETNRALAAENTKAPINHKSATTDYGVADKDNYGHVKTDVQISKTSTNVMQTGALYEYLNRLNTDNANPEYLPTAETYVKALISYLTDTFCTDAEADAIRSVLQTQADTNKDNIAAEVNRAQSAEGNLSFNTGLNHITNLTGAINAENSRAKEAEMSLSTRLDILEAVPDDGKLYVVHWEDDAQNGRILKWTTLDDGELN